MSFSIDEIAMLLVRNRINSQIVPFLWRIKDLSVVRLWVAYTMLLTSILYTKTGVGCNLFVKFKFKLNKTLPSLIFFAALVPTVPVYKYVPTCIYE